ncbi:MAG: NAD-dependent epimerase/dehydratase family protein, partial [Actinomycetota bacterium]
MEGPVLVTGGTGVVGTALVRRLVADGVAVRGLARSDASAQALDAAGATPARGDVLDADAVAAAAAGCDVVFHTAGRSGLCLPDAEAMERLNVGGTETVVRSAAAAGVRRIVLTSSAATLGEAHGAVGDERTAHRGTFLSRYERSKHRAEHLAFDLGRSLGVEVVAVNPASVQGPGRTGGSARLLLDAVAGRLPFLVDTWLSLVDVEDCAGGHVLAARTGVAGERYVLCSAALRARDAIAALRRIWGAPERVRWVPPAIAGTVLPAAGAIVSLATCGSGRRARLCPKSVSTLLHGH